MAKCPFLNSSCSLEDCAVYNDIDGMCSVLSLSISVDRIAEAGERA